MDDADLIYKSDYSSSPFLTFTEIEDGVTLPAYHFKYYQNGTFGAIIVPLGIVFIHYFLTDEKTKQIEG